MKSKMLADNKVGQEVPPFAVKDQNGREVHLEQFKGEWLLLVFHRHLA
ncbi:MAG: peroxiredoxin family protein [Proteobacteria bacterium]|nr:peroxiredoxin family protein [Pseudomonadota bacterium]